MLFLVGLTVGLFTTAVLLAACVATEHVAPIDRYSLRDRLPGATMQIAGAVLGSALIWPVQKLWDVLGLAPFIVLPLWDALQPLGAWAYAVHFLAFVVIADFLAYWRHRAEHSKWLWPVHAVHHAPTELHAANSIGHPLQGLFSFAFITIPMSLIQIPGPLLPLVVTLFVGFLALYIHSPTEIHFGKVARVVVDNRFHRIHHSLEPRHFDKNFGICFSAWDYLFGTAYTPEPGEWPAVGVAGIEAPRTVRDFLALPYRYFVKTRTSPVVHAPCPDSLHHVCQVDPS